MNGVTCLLQFANMPSTVELLYALVILGITLGFGCALTAILFYRLIDRPLSATLGKGSHERLTPAPTRNVRTATRTTGGTVSRPRGVTSTGRRTASTTRTSTMSATSSASRTADARKKQLKHFEKLLVNLEREYTQGTVSTTIYRKLKKEYQERIKQLRFGG